MSFSGRRNFCQKRGCMYRKLILGSLFLFLFSMVLWGLPPFPPPDITAEVTRVIDGDTA